MVKLTRSKTVSDKKSKSPNKKGDTASLVSKILILKVKNSVPKTPKKKLPVKSFIQIKKEILPPKNHRVMIVDKTTKVAVHTPTKVTPPSLPEVLRDSPIARVKSSLSIAKLSPYRFPLLPEKHIATVSKLAGIFMVISGIFLSFLNLYAESDTYARLPFWESLASLVGSQSAQTIAKTSLTVTNVTPDDFKNGNVTPRIAIDAAQPFSGVATVSIVVPYSTKVTLILEDSVSKRLVVLGHATRIDNSTWKFDWHTTDFADGVYRLKTIVKNQSGTYESFNEVDYSIQNNGKNHTVSDSENTKSATSTEEDLTAFSTTTSVEHSKTMPNEVQSYTNVIIEESLELSSVDSLLLKISVLDASEVKVYARDSETQALFYVGLARQKTPETWYIEWKTENLPSHSYSVQAKAKIHDALEESKKISVVVTNGNNQTQSVTSSSTIKLINDSELKPEITIQFSKEEPFSGSVVMNIHSINMSWVELYAQPQSSLTPFFLGLATQTNQEEWKFVWETKQSPNGEYSVYARGKTFYGFVEGIHQKIKVANGIATDFTETEEKKLDTYIDAKNSLTKKVEDGDFLAETGSSTIIEPEDQAYVQTVASFMKEVDIETANAPEVEKLLQTFRVLLQEKMTKLSLAERNSNQEEIQNILNEIESLKQETITNIPKNLEDKEVTLRIEGYVYQIISVLQELTINNERILKERIGDSITLDSDKDEISDYDEVNLYKTNPFVADTDGDSFIDGLEVKGGFDPHNSTAEALITHESPRENGVLREDLLFVDAITTLHSEKGSEEDVNNEQSSQKAIISGRGLPNSFVTVYVFSTPVVVTVRTDAEGNWNYIFDKEIEDGSHEVYVGITDNQGRIVAKSKPFTFVKNAEAFTNSTEEAPVTTVPVPQSFDMTKKIIFLLGSVLVVMLGLILIILGVHLTKRKNWQSMTTVSGGVL